MRSIRYYLLMMFFSIHAESFLVLRCRSARIMDSNFLRELFNKSFTIT